MVSIMKYHNVNSISPFESRSSTIMDHITFMGGLATMSEHSLSTAIAQKHDWDEEDEKFIPKYTHKKGGKAIRRAKTESVHSKRLKKYGVGWVAEDGLRGRLDPRELGMLMEGESKCWAPIRDHRLHTSKYYSMDQKWDKGQKPKHIKAYEHDGLYKSHQDVLPKIYQLEEDLGWLIIELEEYNLLIAQLKHDIEVASDAITAIDRLGSIEHAFLNKGVGYEQYVSDLRYDAFNRKDELEWKLIDAQIDASKRSIDIQCAVEELEKLKDQLYF
jgi:hypothetical protein